MTTGGSDKKSSFIPRYQRIYNDLKKKILDGTYPEGARLPIEHDLCVEYGVERITVRKSLELLVQDGLIVKRAGVGSFVQSSAPAQDVPAPTSNTLLFVMHCNTNDIRSNPSAFNSMLFFAADRACKAFGYSLVYAGINAGENILSIIQRYNASGVFLVSTPPAETADALVAHKIPCICLNHYDRRLVSIVPDNVNGVYEAISLLCRSGHERIAFIGGIPEAFNAAERYNGYRRALIDANLPYDPALCKTGDWTYESGMQAMQQLLALSERPTAVFAASDMMAIGAMEAIRNARLSIPEQISVISFDGTEACRFCVPQLSSIAVDSEQMARVACEHLDLQIRRGCRETDHYLIRLECQLIRRASALAIPEA